MEKNQTIITILVVSLILIILGTIGIVYLQDNFENNNLSTGFGLIPQIEMFEVQIGGNSFYLINTAVIVSIILLVLALVLFWFVVIRKPGGSKNV